MNKPICKLAQAYLDKMCLLCVPRRLKKSQRRVCIDSRMLSTTVASPCQTLRELYTSGRPQVNAYYGPTHQLAVSCLHSSPRVCTSVLFIVIGDIVGVLSGNKPIAGQRISGVITRSTSSQISVVFDDLSDCVDLSDYNGMIQLVKLANDVTYRRIRR